MRILDMVKGRNKVSTIRDRPYYKILPPDSIDADDIKAMQKKSKKESIKQWVRVDNIKINIGGEEFEIQNDKPTYLKLVFENEKISIGHKIKEIKWHDLSLCPMCIIETDNMWQGDQVSE